MRFHRLLGLLLSVAALFWAGCDFFRPAVEARWRFVGGGTLASQTNAPALRAALTLPESAALRGPLLTNAARLFWRLAAGKADAPATALADARPLVADLLDHLSLGETLKPALDRREFAVAVQGDAARAQVWQTAWPRFFAAAQAARGGAPGKPQVLFQAPWIIAVSDASAVTPEQALKTLSQIPAEPQAVLHAEAKLPGKPAAVLDASVRDGAVRSQLKLAFAEALPAKLPAWERPALIRDPVAQFGAARGISGWLGEVPLLKELAGGDLPEQVFVWTKGGTNALSAMQTYVAARVEKPEGWVDRAVAKLQPLYGDGAAEATMAGRLMSDPEHHIAMISDLITPPRLAPLRDKDRNYLLLGMMPPGASTGELPKELLAQIDRPDVLLYDWEITAENMRHWNVAGQAFDMVRNRTLMNHSPGVAWLAAAASKMGESVTEGVVTGPKELTVKRKSAAGFTALELTLFSRWLDGDAPLRHRATKTAKPAPAKPAAK